MPITFGLSTLPNQEKLRMKSMLVVFDGELPWGLETVAMRLGRVPVITPNSPDGLVSQNRLANPWLSLPEGRSISRKTGANEPAPRRCRRWITARPGSGQGRVRVIPDTAAGRDR